MYRKPRRQFIPKRPLPDHFSSDERLIPSVSTSLGGMLTVIRHVGNQSLHVGAEADPATLLVLDETQTEIVVLIFQSINDLVDEKITRPAKAAAVLRLVPGPVLLRVDGLRGLLELPMTRDPDTAPSR